MDTLESDIENIVRQMDKPEANLKTYLNSQQEEQYGVIADLSDPAIRRQTLSDAQALIQNIIQERSVQNNHAPKETQPD